MPRPFSELSSYSPRNMGSDKATAIYLEKTPTQEKKKSCTNTAISWMLGVLLSLALIVITVEFFYPIEDIKCTNCMDDIVIKNEVTKTKTSPPVITDYIEGVQKVGGKNPWDLDFLVDSPQICSTKISPESEEYQRDPEVKMLVLVSSSCSHFKERAAIRNTWGSIAKTPSSPMRLGFVMGTTKNKTEESLIKEESSNYKDIIQADFEDTNTTTQISHKSILMLKWVAKRCPHALFYLKTEDDTFVNVHTLAVMLGGDPFASERNFIGINVQNEKTEEKENNEHGFFPDIFDVPCGSSYVMPGLTAIDLFDVSDELLSSSFLPPEDVLKTGFLSDVFDATLLHDPRFGYQDPPNPPTWSAISSFATAHSVAPDSLEQVWNEMMQSVFNPLFQQEMALNNTAFNRNDKLPQIRFI